jgi:hypothetical protein
MAKKPTPEGRPSSRRERREIKRTERALSGSSYQCPDCPESFGDAAMLGMHGLIAHDGGGL